MYTLPKVLGYKRDKGFMLETDFDAIMKACETATLPDPRIHDGIDPAAWWRALLALLWTSGIRIKAALALRWDQADLDQGVVHSLARDNKGKRDMQHDITAAVPFLKAIQSADPRLLPWNQSRRTLDREFHRIQTAAGIHLDCSDDHEHGPDATCTGSTIYGGLTPPTTTARSTTGPCKSKWAMPAF